MNAFWGIQQDEALREEIENKLKRKFPQAGSAEEAAVGGAAGSAPWSHVEEAVVLAYGRPALFVRKNSFEVPRSDIWSARLDAAREHLEAAIPAVGRIEVRNHPDFAWVGTGWLLDEDGVIVTNRHVAKEFAARSDGSFVFRKNPVGRTIHGSIDFREEHLGPDEELHEVAAIIYVAPDDGADVAFLKLRTRPEGAKPIRLAQTMPGAAEVAVLGYPAWDGRRNPGSEMGRIFDNVYDVKRLAPGNLTTNDAHPHIALHDCTTLGGNSGSVVLSLASGEALGLHFSGRYKKSNYAVAAPTVQSLYDEKVKGAGG